MRDSVFVRDGIESSFYITSMKESARLNIWSVMRASMSARYISSSYTSFVPAHNTFIEGKALHDDLIPHMDLQRSITITLEYAHNRPIIHTYSRRQYVREGIVPQ